jgi:hypothetical protein
MAGVELPGHPGDDRMPRRAREPHCRHEAAADTHRSCHAGRQALARRRRSGAAGSARPGHAQAGTSHGHATGAVSPEVDGDDRHRRRRRRAAGGGPRPSARRRAEKHHRPRGRHPGWPSSAATSSRSLWALPKAVWIADQRKIRGPIEQPWRACTGAIAANPTPWRMSSEHPPGRRPAVQAIGQDGVQSPALICANFPHPKRAARQRDQAAEPARRRCRSHHGAAPAGATPRTALPPRGRRAR